MSGPKVSVYVLAAEQRAIIAAEWKHRQMELEKHKELLMNISRYAEIVLNEKSNLQRYNFVAEECQKNLKDSSLRVALKLASDSLAEIQSELSALSDEKANEPLEAALSGMPRRMRNLNLAVKKVAETANRLEPTLQSQLSKSLISLFTENEEDRPDMKSTCNTERYRYAVEKIESYSCKTYFPASIKTALDAAKKCLSGDTEQPGIESYIAIQLQPLLKRCEEYEGLWEQIGTQYIELWHRYEILLQENDEQDYAEIVSFSGTAIGQLNKLIAVQEAKAQEQAEQEYIATALSEVMEDMGYDICGKRAVTKKDGKHFVNELYQFGPETAVNVTYSDDGKVALELGKMDDCDRLPSQIECRSMAEQMEVFCDRFGEIEERLSKKGVILGNRLLLAPPSQEYAQIINASEYQIIRKTQKISKHKKEKKKMQIRNNSC